MNPMEQSTSPKMDNPNEIAEPTPNGSGNVCDRSLKFDHFCNPCIINKIPNKILNDNSSKEYSFESTLAGNKKYNIIFIVT